MNADAHDMAAPDAAIAALRRTVEAHLSLRTRLLHVALLLASTAATVAVASLLIGERGLPPRTQIAFAVLIAIGASWAAYATWVLTRRRPLLGVQRVVAGAMALAFSAIFTLGSLAIGLAHGGRVPLLIAAGGVGMCLVAGATLARARRDVAALRRRRERLELELAGGAK